MDPISPISIRPAERRDLPALGRLGGALGRRHVEFDPRRYVLAEPAEAAYENFFAAELGLPGTAVLLAERDGTAVGYVFGRVEPASFVSLASVAGWIHDLYVDEPARGNGLGGRLLDAAIAALRELGCTTVMLSVAAQNPAAAALFRRRGFRPALQEMLVNFDAE